MSTRSTITIKRKDGTETSIYCHSDGYIEGVGAILQLAYNTADKVEELMRLGDLSRLGYYTKPKAGTPHDFENRQENVCVAYHRDRGEPFYQSAGLNDFNYTFDENAAVWYVKEEQFVRDTPAMEALYMDYFLNYPTELLLDALRKANFTGWQDDEFAKAGEVYDKCLEKAIEAREDIIKDKTEISDAYYSAYYD